MTAPNEPMHESHVPGYPRRQGKVRDVYDLGDRLVIVATDRISAFDWVLPTPIPDKGRVLTALTLFWLRWLNVPNHLLSAESKDFPPAFRGSEFAGRTMLVRKTAVVPVECVVRGYLAGSGWKDYRRTGAVCGNALAAGLLRPHPSRRYHPCSASSRRPCSRCSPCPPSPPTRR
jgi:phosphoribosylaminoimidazole-succinocarboxamide synthase